MEDATARNTVCREDTDDENDSVTAVTDGVLHFIICNTENVTVVTDVTVKCNGVNARKYCGYSLLLHLLYLFYIKYK